MMMLTISDLAKTFGRKPAVRRIDLEVQEGEILALLGPTGAGKTTTLRCTAGLETPDRGRIHLAGEDVTDVSPMLRDVAMVFEGLNLLPVLSVYDNIAFPLRSPVYRETEREVERRVKKAADDLRISHLLDRSIDKLSGGEKQRVAIARALVRRPKLYLLDEPLSALDLKLRESLRHELRQLHRQFGATILYATHDYHGAAAVADRIALIDMGEILQIGPLSDLLANPVHVSVGHLLGSPAMAVFAAHREGDRVQVQDYPTAFASGDLRLREDAPPDLVIGLWPEDIEFSADAVEGFAGGDVYATDFRGMDRAVQVHFGAHQFRKTVPLSVTLKQGDPCWFRLLPEKAFVFDAASGRRLDSSGG